MTKKGPLSKAEKFWIESHKDRDLKELCKDLDRAQSTVTKFLDTIPGEKTAKTTSSKKETALSKQFARNEKGGAVVMTPNASIMADEQRQKLAGRKSSRCTTKIKE